MGLLGGGFAWAQVSFSRELAGGGHRGAHPKRMARGYRRRERGAGDCYAVAGAGPNSRGGRAQGLAKGLRGNWQGASRRPPHPVGCSLGAGEAGKVLPWGRHPPHGVAKAKKVLAKG